MKKEEEKFWSPNFMAEFKKWMDDSHEEYKIQEGVVVATNLKLKTLISRMDCQESYENSVIDVAKHFKRHGGTVTNIQNEQVTIKTKKGIFTLNKEDIIGN
jgi:hypothetical protein